MYISEECEIYCPNCKKDSLYVARQCYVCKRWNYFDGDAITHKCKKCDIDILKDFDEAKKQIKLQHEKSKEIKLATEQEKDDFFKAAIKIPNSELKELIKEIIDEEEQE